MKLVIVESPTKARTISKFLDKTYIVKSSYGHIRDLPKKEMGVDIENNFAPHYIIPTAARKKVKELKEASQKAKEVILATDEDREGEAIAWHLAETLNLNEIKTQNAKRKAYRRIVFHEITKNAILKALENPRNIDQNLVDAQQARRILDRLVGYELSPFLWKKVKRGLSAGRVQSMALRFIVEREREIERFKRENYFTVSAELIRGETSNKFEVNLIKIGEKNIEKSVIIKLFAGDYKIKKTIIDNAIEAEKIKADLEKASYKVKNIQEKETIRYPLPPFTTSTLQQAAVSNLGFSAKLTMSVAQKLYEQGYITYMRTDSVNLSLESMLSAKKTIAKLFGKNYALLQPRFFKTKSKGAQEAHEAIRPTYPHQTPDDLKNKLNLTEYKLYDLIWKRMLASQMPPAIFDSVKTEIEASAKQKYTLQANGSTLKFDGFLRIYNGVKSLNENILPKMKIGDKLNLISVKTQEKSTTPPPRYNEATLVKVLEENGIGRPSTYAPTISTIIDRKYAEKNEEKRLQPMEIGLIVNDLLVEHFPEIVDIKFTANIEEDFDEIAQGKDEWVEVVRKFYTPFHKHLEIKNTEVKKENVLEKLDRNCPDCGGSLIVKFGRFGKFIACANFPNCKYTEKTAEEKKVDEENAGATCDLCGAPMTVKRGKFGAFLGCSRYPECKGIKKIENKTGIKCPKCGQGEIIVKKSKRGKTFYGCNKYPKCDFVSWTKPQSQET